MPRVPVTGALQLTSITRRGTEPARAAASARRDRQHRRGHEIIERADRRTCEELAGQAAPHERHPDRLGRWPGRIAAPGLDACKAHVGWHGEVADRRAGM